MRARIGERAQPRERVCQRSLTLCSVTSLAPFLVPRGELEQLASPPATLSSKTSFKVEPVAEGVPVVGSALRTPSERTAKVEV